MKEGRRAVLWSALGTLAGAVFYLVDAIAAGPRPGWRPLLDPDLLFWLLGVAIPVFPAAFAAVLLTRLAARWGMAATAIAAIAGAAGSIPLFSWYMRYWFPLVAWERAWTLPLAGTVSALILDAIDRSRRGRGRAEL